MQSNEIKLPTYFRAKIYKIDTFFFWVQITLYYLVGTVQLFQYTCTRFSTNLYPAFFNFTECDLEK